MLQLISVLSSARGRAVSLHIIQGLKQLQEENARLRTSMHEMEKISRGSRKNCLHPRCGQPGTSGACRTAGAGIFQRVETPAEKLDETIDDKAFPDEVGVGD